MEAWEGTELWANCLNSMWILGLENKCVQGKWQHRIRFANHFQAYGHLKPENGVPPSEDTLNSSLSHSSVHGYPVNGWELLRLLFRPSSPFPKSDSFYETGSQAATYRTKSRNECVYSLCTESVQVARTRGQVLKGENRHRQVKKIMVVFPFLKSS